MGAYSGGESTRHYAMRALGIVVLVGLVVVPAFVVGALAVLVVGVGGIARLLST